MVPAPSPVRPPVAIVHDYLTQRGGAERVVLSMLQAFPDAPLYTSVYDPDATFPEFRSHDVRPLWTDKVPGLRRDHRRGLLFYPLAFSGLTVDAEVTVCSSSGFAHGVRATGRKVVYCYTPARWLYGEADAYLAAWSPAVRALARTVARPLRAWDQRAARSAGHVVTSSTAVRERIRRTYHLEATVVPPPMHVDTAGPQRPLAGIEPGFVLSVGRLLAYKNVDALVAAMAEVPDERLVVVGAGPERERLAAMAGPNVTIAGAVDDAELRWCYAHCAALVSASFEDYGLTPIEAAAHGKPAAVLRRGGFLDTVVEGETGVFFDEAHPHAIAEAVDKLLAATWDAARLAAHADGYSPAGFAERLRALAAVDVAPVGAAPMMGATRG